MGRNKTPLARISVIKKAFERFFKFYQLDTIRQEAKYHQLF